MIDEIQTDSSIDTVGRQFSIAAENHETLKDRHFMSSKCGGKVVLVVMPAVTVHQHRRPVAMGRRRYYRRQRNVVNATQERSCRDE